jgi:hypothetical protein
MTDELARIEADIEAGRASAVSLVQLFDAVSAAEQRGDLAALARACALARWLTEVLPNGLASDAIRLSTLCKELFVRAQATTPVTRKPCSRPHVWLVPARWAA